MKFWLKVNILLRVYIDTVLQHFKMQMGRLQGLEQSGGTDTADYLPFFYIITDFNHFVCGQI